jgi:hypothetical protein
MLPLRKNDTHNKHGRFEAFQWELADYLDRLRLGITGYVASRDEECGLCGIQRQTLLY